MRFRYTAFALKTRLRIQGESKKVLQGCQNEASDPSYKIGANKNQGDIRMRQGLMLWIALFLAGCVVWKPSKPVGKKPPLIQPLLDFHGRTSPITATGDVYRQHEH